MVSDKFMVNSDAGRMAAARYATENYAWQMKLGKRDTMRLSLLVEETLGMVKAMVEDFYGQLWFSGDGRRCEIHLEATTDMDADKKQELLSVSSTGKNALAKGFMAMIAEVFSSAMHGFGNAIDAYGQETVQYGIVHTSGMGMLTTDGMVPIWTLQSYRDGLNRQRGANGEADEAWDELEKSIVAKLADDVVVGVKGDRIELVIVKEFKD